MSWRPSSWWARSQDRQPTPDPRPPAAPPDTSNESGQIGESGQASASRQASGCGAWRDLPTLTPTSATPVQRVAVRDDFAPGLASHTDPRFLQRLTHLVDPSIGGLVDGLALPGVPHDRDAGPELAVPQRPSPRATPRVQRQVTWSGAADLPTVRWELPRAVTPERPDAPTVDDRQLISMSPDDPAATTQLSTPAVRPASPVLQRAVAVDPPRFPRAEQPAMLQRDLFATTTSAVATRPSPAVSAPDAPADAPPMADAAVARPSDLAAPSGPSLDHDHGRPEVLADGSTSGWTEVALPLAPSVSTAPVERPIHAPTPTPIPIQRSVPAESTARPTPLPAPLSAADPTARIPSHPGSFAGHSTPDVAIPSAANLPEPAPGPAPIQAPLLQAPLVQRAVGRPTGSDSPTQQAPSTIDAAPLVRPESAQISIPVGVPLVQRSTAAPTEVPTEAPVHEAIGASGGAMSFASMFAGPAPSSFDDRSAPDPAPGARDVAQTLSVGARELSASAIPPPGGPAAAAVPPPMVQRFASAAQGSSTAAQASPTPALSALATVPSMPVQRAPVAATPAQAPSQTWVRATPVRLPVAPVQRQPAAETSSSDPSTVAPDAAPEPSPAEQPEPPAAVTPTETAPTAPAAASSGAPAAGDLDEMARRLYEPLVARIRAELWLDRERAGVFGDG